MLLTLTALIALSPSPTICIDPGHPSEVGSGSKGLRVTELEAVWQVGNELSSILKKKGYKVVLTKSDLDQMVTNRERAAVANRNRAALMVRLHCDAATGSGFAIYYPAQKGIAHGRTGPSDTVLARSASAAKKFHAAMASMLHGKLKDNGIKSDEKTAVGARQGALTGSIFSDVPVLLVEMVVLTNPKDEAFLLSRSGRLAMVEALARGVEAAVPLEVRK